MKKKKKIRLDIAAKGIVAYAKMLCKHCNTLIDAPLEQGGLTGEEIRHMGEFLDGVLDHTQLAHMNSDIEVELDEHDADRLERLAKE